MLDLRPSNDRGPAGAVLASECLMGTDVQVKAHGARAIFQEYPKAP